MKFLQPLKNSELRAYIVGNTFFTIALLIQEVVLAYQVYQLTKNPLTLGLIGLAEAVPFISIALYGGHLADNKNKKKVMQWSLMGIILGSIILVFSSLNLDKFTVDQYVGIIYFVIFLIGFCKGLFSPASNALNQMIVPKEKYSTTVPWIFSMWQMGMVVGPASAGFLYIWFGVTGTLWIVIGLLLIVFSMIFYIKDRPSLIKLEQKEKIWTSLKQGIGYVFKTKAILYSISLDLFSVLFGGVIAILPVFAEDILHVGAEGLGFLRAAPALGSTITMLLLIVYPPVQQAWKKFLWAVLGYGIFTVVFGLSTNYYLSLAALFLTGAFDSISVVIRQMALRYFTPDEMRGRVSSVNSIFVSSSNELGAFESGVATKIFGAVPAVVGGGIITVLIVGMVALNSKELYAVKFE